MPYDDTHIAIMKFPNGVMGKVFVSVACKRNYTMRSVFYGTKGTIICDNKSPQIYLHQPKADDPKVIEEHIIPVTLADHNTVGEFRAFADCVLNDTDVPMSAEQGARTVAACFAIVQSSVEGRSVVPDYDFSK